jgi:hypothetical protein
MTLPLLCPTVLGAATHTWTGAVNNLWSVNGNWTGGSPIGDPNADLVFPSGAANLSTSNDIVGTSFVNSITFNGSGYTLGGSNPLAIANNITGVGTNTISLSFSLYGGATHAISSDGHLIVSGMISGEGAITEGAGTVELAGNNTLASLNTDATSTLINGSEPATGVDACNGLLGGTGTTGSIHVHWFLGVAGNCFSILDPGPATGTGVLNAQGNLQIDGGSRFRVRINGPTAGTEYDQLTLTGSATFQGVGTMSGIVYPGLEVALGYDPPLGTTFTIIQAPGGITGPLGGGDGTIFTTSNCVNLQIHYTANAVTLTRVAGGGTPLTDVTINATGFRTVCTNSTGGTATVTDTGGCGNTHQWGYRTVSGGTITPIAGQTGTSYHISGADFGAPGTYYLVETTTPTAGSPLTSNEITITVTSPPTAVAGGSTTVCPGGSAQLTGSGGSTCSWSPAAGLDDPTSCTPVATPLSTTTYSLTVISGSCASTNLATATVTVGGPDSLYTVAPCRLLDTRNPNGPYGGPAIAGQSQRSFVAVGQCSVPPGAKAISANVTITQPSTAGDLRFYPSDRPVPLVSTINYAPGQTRANNAVIALACDGNGDFAVQNDGNGNVHLIVDVNGYFQ